MTDFVRDILYAFRLIRKAPLFSLYVIVPLALGIGLNGAIFILLDALLLRPLPVKNPEQLVRLVQVVQNLGPRSYYSYDAFEALQRKSTSLTETHWLRGREYRGARCERRDAGFAARS